MNELMSNKPCSNKPYICLITLGCAKNEVDSDNMRTLLQAAGYEVGSAYGRGVSVEGTSMVGESSQSQSQGQSQGQSDDASIGAFDAVVPSVVIINSCSFITSATQESINLILQLAQECQDIQAHKDVPAPKLVVTGCMPSRYGEELAREIPEVSAFVNVKDEPQIVQIVQRILGDEQRDEGQQSNASEQGDAGEHVDKQLDVSRSLGAPSAYVKISDGCDRFCSFCTIPFIRGRYVSRLAQQIIDEVDCLVAGGTAEIVLIGQDTGVWGDDFTQSQQYAPLSAPTLASLMELLAQRHPSTWIRVMYLQPERIDEELLRVMAQYSNVCSYLDIPLQHCSPKVIEEMNRSGSGEEYLQTLQHVREAVPGVTLRTTVIAGFPGESDDEAQQLAEFMYQAQFDYAGVFAYSPENGTAAGKRLDQVPEQVALERVQMVSDAIEQCGLASAEARVGNVYDVLVCGVEGLDDELGSDPTLEDPTLEDMLERDIEDDILLNDNSAIPMWGRAQFQAPEVDSVIYFDAPRQFLGKIVSVCITATLGYDLEGVIQE